MKHLTDYMRLEIGVDPTGLPNLVQNPSGEFGAWGYVTPVANTNMYTDTLASGKALQFSQNTTTAAYFTTELMPVVAGRYVAARYDNPQWSGVSPNNMYHKARFEFYKADKTLISSSTQTALTSGVGTFYVAPSLAPALTAYVKLRFDFYLSTGAVSNVAFLWYFKNVMVTHAATSGAIQTVRTNRITNPSFEVGLTTWALAFGNALLSRVSGNAYAGSFSGQVTFNDTLSAAFYSPSAAVVGGTDYVASLYQKAGTAARLTSINFQWYDAGGNAIGSNGSSALTGTGTYARVTSTATAPSNAASAKMVVYYQPGPTGTAFIDAAMIETGTVAGTYFDGSNAAAGTKTYAWTGTANASTSTETDTQIAFADPIQWQNIFGPTADVAINREDLNVGTMTATIHDALLDPSVAGSIIKPGKPVRVVAYGDGTYVPTPNVWVPIFTGVVTEADVSYPVDTKTGKKNVAIRLAASDAITQLANQGDNRVLNNVNDLPYILEGKGVPWNVNGSGNQVTSATVVAYNENASVLDQVAVTRDTNMANAWMDPSGVLNVWNRDVPGAYDYSYGPGRNAWNITGWTATNATLSVVSNNLNILSTNTSAVTVKSPMVPVSRDTARVAYEYTNITHPTASFVTSTTLNGYKNGVFVGVIFTVNGNTNSAGSGGGNTPTANYDAVQWVWTIASTLSGNNYTLTTNALTASYATLNTSKYSDIDLGWNSGDCINSVSVKWLRYDVGTGETTEITYGPYENPTSIKEWGAHSKEFTIAGAAANENETYIAAFANSVLAANGTPKKHVNSLTVPVSAKIDGVNYNGPDLQNPVALFDLNRTITVYADNASYVVRVASVQHNIGNDEWTVTYGFSAGDSVAAPTWTPSPPFTGVTTGWVGATLTSSWQNYGVPYANAAYRRIGNMVYLRGLIKLGVVGGSSTILTLPSGYRPPYAMIFAGITNTVTTGAASTGTAHTHATGDVAVRININADGTLAVSNPNAANGYISLDNICFLID